MMAFSEYIRSDRSNRVLTLGLASSAVWLALLLLFWLLVPGGTEGGSGIGRLLAFVGMVMPLVLIWMAVALAEAIGALRAEADELRLRLSQMRDGNPIPGMGGGTTGAGTGGGIAPGPVTGNMPPRRPAATPSRADGGDARQGSIPLEHPEPVEIPPEIMVRALNFPDGPQDTDAVAALRTALQNHDNARVLRASQDVITLLAGHGLYMDDLAPHQAPVALWRHFAEGARGAAVADLGGIHEADALATVSELLRGDEIFRDSTHHFLRHFDMTLARIIPQLGDDDILLLSQSRSSRAFMLLGRAAGIFG